jgi:cyclopropane fatty-acyl-phospholipid synthase-like methyltransferase
LGWTHAGAYLANAAAKSPGVPTDKHDLQELRYEGEFDGVLCVDAMEFVPPEDWPVVLGRFRRALRSGGWLYLTFGLARRSGACGHRGGSEVGLPVVDGEVVWDRPNGY